MDPDEMKTDKNSTAKQNDDVPSVRTYKSDVAEFIKREGKTLADIAIAENARHINTLNEETATPLVRKKAVYIISTIIFLIILSFGIFYFTLKPKSETLPTAPNGQIQQGMFVSGIKEKIVSIGQQNESGVLSLIDIALKEVQPFLDLKIISDDKSGQTSLVPTKDFLEKIGVYPPGDLIRALSPNFALGSIGGKTRFIVLKNNYYGGAFSGMLQWEKTIIDDLRNVLDLPIIKNSSAVSTGTTTTSNQLKPAVFLDTVVANRDGRIFKDGSGATIILYLFSDNDTIIITGSESSAKIIMEKLLKTSAK